MMGNDLLYDAHCHLTPHITPKRVDQLLTELTFTKEAYSDEIFRLNLMSTNQFDIDYVDRISQASNGLINPCFGIHPWYCHLFTFTKFEKYETISTSDAKRLHYSEIFSKSPDDALLDTLPTPIYIFDQLEKIENLLIRHPGAMVGEIGIDKLFRIPRNGYLGNLDVDASDSTLGTIQVKMEHQLKVYESLLKLAMKYKRPVSVHCVKAHGVLFENTKRILGEERINICLHSYSGSTDQAKLWVKTFKEKLYFSLSEIINAKSTRGIPDATQTKTIELLKVVPREGVLIETDFGIDRLSHEEHTRCLQGIIRLISSTYTDMEYTNLLDNWHRFIAH